MKDKTVSCIVSIVCLTVLEIVNLCTVGLDGIVLESFIAAVAGLGGYTIGKVGGKK